MNLLTLPEPVMEFGEGEHICPRAGIAEFGVYDIRLATRKEKIVIGAIGTSEDLDKLQKWLERCKSYIAGKLDSKQPTLFPPFCGFNTNAGYKSEIIINDDVTRSIQHSDIREILRIKNFNDRVESSVNLYYRHARFLTQNRPIDVLVCIIANDLFQKIGVFEATSEEPALENEEEDVRDLRETNFRRSLKAKCMHLGKPTQLVLSQSLGTDVPGKQDDATRAWNFCTAIYYKANQTVPWKLKTNVNRPSICYVGIGFYRSRDKKSLHSSLAQVFDELGNGVILRGTPILQKEDRVPHLTAEQAHDLLQKALEEYENALGNSPARLVIHKTSKFHDAEIDGFKQITTNRRINATDFVTILDTDIRLLRKGIYPPYRGTFIDFDGSNCLLYTRGSVDYYKTQTSKYVPRPIEVRVIESDESPIEICKEILSLTKLNWNNTQFDQKYPITIGCARRVGQIMKYVPESESPQIRYSFYM